MSSDVRSCTRLWQRARSTEVPTAHTRDPRSLAALTISTRVPSTFISLAVHAMLCKILHVYLLEIATPGVQGEKSAVHPFISRRFINSRLKCIPAAGAITAPRCAHKYTGSAPCRAALICVVYTRGWHLSHGIESLRGTHHADRRTKTQRTAARRGVVDHLGHQRVILRNIIYCQFLSFLRVPPAHPITCARH